jgi:hypothetical protein
MPVLHLGVVDLPYVGRRGVTTGDVAGWLENRYHVLEHFMEVHHEEIAADLESSLAGALENVMAGAPLDAEAFATGASAIEDRMKSFVAEGEMESLGYPGVPTQASLDRASGKRRSARFKRRRATGKSVSFVDSGLYQSSLKAWVE